MDISGTVSTGHRVGRLGALTARQGQGGAPGVFRLQRAALGNRGIR
jgi:hypothetical protein